MDVVQPHVVYCSACMAVDGAHFVKNLTSDQAHQDHNKIIIMMDIAELIGLICTRNSKTFFSFSFTHSQETMLA